MSKKKDNEALWKSQTEKGRGPILITDGSDGAVIKYVSIYRLYCSEHEC